MMNSFMILLVSLLFSMIIATLITPEYFVGMVSGVSGPNDGTTGVLRFYSVYAPDLTLLIYNTFCFTLLLFSLGVGLEFLSVEIKALRSSQR